MSDPHRKRVLGKVVVTGAARGQGPAESEALTREGARVIATDIDPAAGCRHLDVSRGEEWAALAAELEDMYGQVNDSGWRRSRNPFGVHGTPGALGALGALDGGHGLLHGLDVRGVGPVVRGIGVHADQPVASNALEVKGRGARSGPDCRDGPGLRVSTGR
ncbi:hypothetical protein GCM10022384_08040 [Streptomyces marokkonensis]|uniref:Uncharacterized protein n=1 Tax=Streptomyces marokkonensis TaxID=324855 RepID=A0ABP7NZW0_9ACTN